MAPKRKQAAAQVEPDSDEMEFDDEDDELVRPQKKKAAPKRPRAPKITEPEVDADGWHTEPPSLIWKDFGAEPAAKVAAFDLDGTLVNTKSGQVFARTADDWRWWNKDTPAKIAEFADEGYKIVIFSNQGAIKTALGGLTAIKVKERCKQLVSELQEKHDVTVQVFMAPSIATDDPCRKPNTGMWDYFVANCNGGIKPDLKSSFYCGDADGAPGAFSDSDKVFAQRIGLPFKSPFEVFRERHGKPPVDREGIHAGKQLLEQGDHPNADLIAQFEALAAQVQAKLDAGEGDSTKDGFRARAYKNVASALAGFSEKVSEDNLKAVGKLKGIGKATLAKIKMYLEKGTIEEGVGSPKREDKPQQLSKAAEAAMKFL